MDRPTTVLCLSSHFKGTELLPFCKQEGCHVILLTREKLADKNWPMDAVDERFLMPELTTRPDIFYAVSYLARERIIDRIIPLNDYDVETAAALREHLRIPGMGDTTARYFRDKLAMRFRAREAGLRVPDFVPIINYDHLRDFMGRVSPPWVLKPRSEAGAMGIKKVHSEEELWRRLDELGDRQSFFLLEQFVAGDVFHVDSIISERELVFRVPHKYWRPPMNVAHEGGIFISRTIPDDSEEGAAILQMNQQLMEALGMVRGVAHTEFIRGHEDGQFYFLETAARVGGANIAELVEASTGVNLWQEWVRIEVADAEGREYQLPEHRRDYAGILICLAKQAYPDLSAYQEPEIVWRLQGKKHHAGLIVAADTVARVESLLEQYSHRFAHDFLAIAPPVDSPDELE